jgi:hypothetical protein
MKLRLYDTINGTRNSGGSSNYAFNEASPDLSLNEKRASSCTAAFSFPITNLQRTISEISHLLSVTIDHHRLNSFVLTD